METRENLLTPSTGKPTVVFDQPDESNDAGASDHGQERVFRLYRRRWFVLFVASLLNASNAFSWIAFAPVANYTDVYYGAHASNWLSLVFLISAVPVGILAMWSAGKYGLRSAILTASWLNGIGAVMRLFSNIPGISQPLKFAVVLIGQCIAAFGYPFIMFLPTKIAAAWFPNNQRTFANSIASLSNPIGVLIANLISPRVVVETWQIILLNIISSIPAVTACILATAGVRTSEPPVPPTVSAAKQATSFLKGLIKLSKSRSYLILLFCLGGGIGIFNTLYTVMQQILCARGYHNEFAGVCCILMIISGVIGASVSSFLVDRTKLFEEVMKAAFSFAVLSGILFTFTSRQNDAALAIAFSCVLFGTFGLAAYPIGLELGAECTFPVAASTSTGLMVLSGQLQSAIFITIVQSLSVPLVGVKMKAQVCQVDETEESSVKALDMTRPLLILCSLASFSACLFVLAFKPKLKRVVLERGTVSSINASARSMRQKEGIIEVKTIMVPLKKQG